ncbi:head-tail adaptor protein [Chitinophaga sp.]|uniref:head-tail adaptor protein n=1 Tax=Chitinophaga sp. TaxID=1869181 RepID=UPI0031E4843C
MIGKMRARIIFKEPTLTPVGGGGTEATYTDLSPRWAEAIPVRSQAEVEAYKTSLGKVYRFRLRYEEAFYPQYDMLIAYDGKLYSVAGIEEVKDRHRFWVITGVEKE